MENSLQKVLLVDDEPRNLRIITEILDDKYEISTAANGEQALEIVKNGFIPDLIFLDIMMPGLNGYEVCREFRLNKNLILTKIVLVSGKGMIEERLEGYDAGADDYIVKPYAPEELLSKAKVFLKLAATEGALRKINENLDLEVKRKTDELFAAKATLIHASKLSSLGEMACGIAHEINTPLASIMILTSHISQLCKKQPTDADMIAKKVEKIDETSKRIAKIIKGLKFFARDARVDPFLRNDIREIINDTLELCGTKLRSSGVELSIVYPEEANSESWWLECRATEISQVLLNLLNNAADAISEQAERWIKVSVETDANTLKLKVTDSGKGIPKAVADRLFEPFFTTKEAGHGTGLGLSISIGIIKSHGGSLNLIENSPNTCFEILLKRQQNQGRKELVKAP